MVTLLRGTESKGLPSFNRARLYFVYFCFGALLDQSCFLAELQTIDGLLDLSTRGSNANDNSCPGISTERTFEYLGQRRVSEWHVFLSPLGELVDDLSKIEQGLVDAQSLLHPHVGLHFHSRLLPEIV